MSKIDKAQETGLGSQSWPERTKRGRLGVEIVDLKLVQLQQLGELVP